MTGLAPVRRWSRRFLLPVAALTMIAAPDRARGQYDLTGDWRVRYHDGVDTTEWDVPIVQQGGSLMVADWRGSIDPETGRFMIITFQHPRCHGPWGIHAEMIDPNHFTGNFGGFIFFEVPPCRQVSSIPVNGVRLDPIDLCAGDCDGNGRTTVNEVVRLVRCVLDHVPAIEQPCARTCAADVDGSGAIAVNELVDVVNNALRGCP